MTTTATPAIDIAVPTGTWTVDPDHSSVEFRVKHMGIATVRGEFTEYEGTLEVAEDGSLRAYGTVQAASLTTRNGQRDQHLRSPDFFAVGDHPVLSFESTGVTPVDGDTFRIAGELTIRGVTRPIELVAELQGRDVDPWGNERVALEVTGSLDRTDYGLTWNQALESGGLLVGKQVKLTLNVSAVKAA